MPARPTLMSAAIALFGLVLAPLFTAGTTSVIFMMALGLALSITNASGTVNQNWLESAFLEKQAGIWKIVFMHSTRVRMATQEKHGK